MIREIGMKIGDAISVAILVITDEEGRCIGPYMHLRAIIDITKPLRRVAKVSLGSSGGSVWVDLKYESAGLLFRLLYDWSRYVFVS